MVPLLADPNRKGMFRGQFIALQPGPVRIEIADSRFARKIRCRGRSWSRCPIWKKTIRSATTRC